jgi:hypothetical protein
MLHMSRQAAWDRWHDIDAGRPPPAWWPGRPARGQRPQGLAAVDCAIGDIGAD